MSLIFEPYTHKNVTLPNRIVMSPMCMYSATPNGEVSDWHIVHYGTRAVGRVGLILLEATAVESRGRISDRDLGIWGDHHVEGLKKLVDFAHGQGVKIGIQLAHAGRKAVLDEPIIAPSAIPFDDRSKMPQEMSKTQIDEVIRAFREAARRADAAGFDVVEIHAAHGYLLHEFLSPLSNRREDEYGGSLTNRFRMLKEVVRSVREVWPEERPLYVRISAVDYAEGGLTLEDSVEIARLLKEEGVDLIDVSSGGLLPNPPGRVYPGYQVGYAETLRKEVDIPTGCVGMITTPEQAEEILGNGRADLVFLGRELLRHPYWVIDVARQYGHAFGGARQYERAYR
jgi:NADPH2 dehydrogenase